jgi:hypothetical protein
MSEQPQPENFGVTPEQVAAYRPPTRNDFLDNLLPFRKFLIQVAVCVALVLPVIWCTNYPDTTISKWLGWLALPGLILAIPYSIYVTALFFHLPSYAYLGIVWLFRLGSAKRSPVPRNRIEAYLRAKAEYEKTVKQAELEQKRSEEDYWHSLSGKDFETELARLYKLAGYTVETTSVTGDEGADLLLRKDGQLTVVQCKRHSKPVGPATVRELHGTLLHFGGALGILAATGGFTDGARRHAHGKPIELLDLDGILSLQETFS